MSARTRRIVVLVALIALIGAPILMTIGSM